MNAAVNIPVQFSPSALQELKRLNENRQENQVLRVGVKGGGCSGMTYILEYDEKGETDVPYEVEGLPFIINQAHEIYLYGTKVEFDDGLNSRGFTFRNPNATSTCGCGTSFAV